MIRRFVLRHLAVLLGITLLAVGASQPASVYGAPAGTGAAPAPDARARVAAWLGQYHARHGSWDGVAAPLQLAEVLLEAPVALVDAQGQVLAGTVPQRPDATAGVQQLPIPAADGRPLATLAILGAPPRPALPAGEAPWPAALPLLVALLLLGAATLGLGVGALRTLRGPLLALRAAAVQLGQGELETRVVPTGRDELAALAGAFNTMAEGIAALERRRRALLAEVAHDLRTPLTVLGGYLEGLHSGRIADRRSAEQAFVAMTQEVDYLAALVAALGQASIAAQSGTLAPVAPAALIAGAVRRLQPLAAARGITVTTALPPQLPLLPADGNGLRRLLANLLDNSLRHTPAGGSITVQAAVDPRSAAGPRLVIQVRDSGVGMAPDQLAQLGARSPCVAPSGRGRRGLGLAIASAMVAAHGGSMALASQRGVGTVVTVRLPLAKVEQRLSVS